MGSVKSKVSSTVDTLDGNEQANTSNGPAVSRSAKKMAYFRSLRSTRGSGPNTTNNDKKSFSNRKSFISDTGITNLSKSKSLSSLSTNNKLRKSFVNKNDDKSDCDSKSNANNDELIADLKKKIDYLSEQLELMDKEDSKIISELESKVENLSQLNSSIMTKFDKPSKVKPSKDDQEKMKQQKALLDQYHARITQQQNQIDQLRLLLHQTPTSPQPPPPQGSAYNSFMFTHPQQQYFQHQPNCKHTHNQHNHHHKHKSHHSHYYSMPHQQQDTPSTYYMSYDSSSTIYYDPNTGQYFYYPQQVQHQQAPSFTYTFTTTTGSSESSKASTSTSTTDSNEDTNQQQVIITEVTTDDEQDDSRRDKNIKKDYVDAISLDEEKTV